MNSLERTIKNCAMAFAIVLAIGIVSVIAGVVGSVLTAVTGGFSNNEDVKDFTDSFTNVKSLDINNSTGNLIIKVGDTFKVEAVNVKESFEATLKGNGTLKLDSNNSWEWLNFSNWFGSDDSDHKTKITVYLPADFVAEHANIDSGAGNITIEALKTRKLIIDAGAGRITGSNMTAADVEIDGGIGKVKFTDVVFQDADIDCGVGEITIEGKLLGKNVIDCGVGEVNLELYGKAEDYNFDIDKGLGNIKINGVKVKDRKTRDKNLDNSLDIDGGVGNINIDFK